MSENNFASIIEKAPSQIKQWIELIPLLLELFKKLSKWVYIVILVAISLAAYNYFQWWRYSEQINKRIESSLRANLDNTVWQHKGLAAYLLSDIENKTLTPSSVQVSEEIRQSITSATEIVKKQNSISAAEIKDKLRLKIYSKDPNIPIKPMNQSIIGGNEFFYVFLPAMSLTRSPIKYSQLNDENLTQVLEENPDALQDLTMALNFIELMQTLNKATVNSKNLVQTYFITESGLILIMSPRSINQQSFYNKKFETHYNFPDRSYFWDAVNKTQGDKNAPFDYASEPYVDLGGHGLVKTFSKALELPNQRIGVLCFDIQIGNLETVVKERIAALGGSTGTFFWSDSGGIENEAQLPETFKSEFAWFKDNVNNSRSGLLGRIAYQGDFQRDYSGEDKIVRFTIPLSTEVNGENRKVNLLWVRIDLGEFWRKQDMRLFVGTLAAGFGIFFFAFSVYNVYDNYKLLKKGFREFSDNLDRVMSDANTPYIRVNQENEFIFVNKKFLDLLGYKTLQALKYEGVGYPRTFMSILTPDSQKMYTEILKESEKGEKTGIYKATLIRADNTTIEVQAHGEKIAFPSITEQKFPNRFGIIIEEETKEKESKKANRIVGKSIKGKN